MQNFSDSVIIRETFNQIWRKMEGIDINVRFQQKTGYVLETVRYSVEMSVNH